jgi:peptidoglycan/LPS O-acetylase OafA/YrhL
MSSPAAGAGSPGWSRLDGVDLLRGLAIFLVLIHHVNIRLVLAKVPYTHGMPRLLVDALFWNGQFAVQMFFAISGFLITSIALRRWRSLDEVNIRDFYLLRFARIAPLLLGLLVVLSGLHFAHFSNYVVQAKTGGLGRAVIAALTFHLNLLEGWRGYLPGSWDVLWSLSVEEMFYLFFPLLARLFGRGKVFITILFAFAILGPFGRRILTEGNPIWREKSYLGGMDAIALGCLAAILASRIHFSRRTLRLFGWCGSGLIVLILGFAPIRALHGIDRFGLEETILAIGTCMVIVTAAQTGWTSPRLLRPLLVVGQRSYEIYLTHMFIVFAFFGIFLRLGKPMWAVPVFFVATVIVAALLGELVARLYSEPANRWLRTKFGENRLGSAIESKAGKGDSAEFTTSAI